MRKTALLVLVSVLCLARGTVAADLAYGEYLAGECVACHREGAEAGIPSIDALSEKDFIQALHDYRDGRRDHALMQNVAKSLGDAEIEALAAYFEQRGD